jgi:prephenate dehydrogenase
LAKCDHGNLLSLGIIGLGAFGRLMAEHLSPHFRLYGFDPAVSEDDAAAMKGVALASLSVVACCDIVVLATPVNSFGAVIAAIRPYLRPGTLALDVGSVKIAPCAIMNRDLPEGVDIVGTHPLFGPQSARGGIRGLKIAVCPVRGAKAPRVAAVLRKKLGLKVIVATPDAHDREVATAQGLTHLIAKVLIGMEPLPTRITAPSFDMLAKAAEMVRYDAPEVFLAIERTNPYAQEVRKRFFALAAGLDAELTQSDAGERY